MREVIVINYTGRHGSGNIHALDMARELIYLGENVVAIVSKDSDNIVEWSKLNLVKLIKIDTYNSKVSFCLSTMRLLLFERMRIKKELEEFVIKSIYCPMCTYWTYFINQIFVNTRVVICKHDPEPHDGKRESVLFEKAFRDCDCVVVHSNKFVDLVKGQYPSKEVAYLPLTSLGTYDNSNKEKDPFYDNYNLNFIFFGVINDYKGLDVLGKAFKKLCENRKDVSLTIAANGDFSKYEQLYSKLDNCRVVNRWIKDEEIPIFFSSEKLVTVLPYKNATQSGVALVAKKYLSPIIATATGGLDEQVIDGKTGLLIEPDNVDSLVGAMNDLCNQSNKFIDMKNEIEKENINNDDRKIAKKLLILLGKED